MAQAIKVFNEKLELTTSDILAERPVWMASGMAAARLVVPAEVDLPADTDFAINVLVVAYQHPVTIEFDDAHSAPEQPVELTAVDQTAELRFTRGGNRALRIRYSLGRYE